MPNAEVSPYSTMLEARAEVDQEIAAVDVDGELDTVVIKSGLRLYIEIRLLPLSATYRVVLLMKILDG